MVKFGSFKGHPTISLVRDENDRYPFTFGLAKAKAILANLKAIETFVAEAEAANAAVEAAEAAA